ncbi:MAG: prepilin peptidase [Ruminococcaceae bacterium]|nr:prepilin peptidase [Oscillospiraceae bacterium]
MASTCPNCGRRLRWYDVKAECKDCGVSIPNFNWEARLEEDADLAAKKSLSFHRTMNMFKYSIWGTKLRIVRIIMSFLPAVGFLLPWYAIKSDAQSIGIDMFGIFTDGNSLIDLFKAFFGNMKLFFLNMGYEGSNGVLTFSMLALLFMLLSALFIVIAFFMILFTNKHPKSKLMVIFDALSICSAVVSSILFTVGMKGAANQPAVNFGNIPLYNISGKVMWGYFIALVLLCVAFVFNFLVMRAPAKSHEELEEERLARKAEKEAKEEQKRIEREKAQKEAEEKAAEEQARIVAEAKAKLEARKEKKNK